MDGSPTLGNHPCHLSRCKGHSALQPLVALPEPSPGQMSSPGPMPPRHTNRPAGSQNGCSDTKSLPTSFHRHPEPLLSSLLPSGPSSAVSSLPSPPCCVRLLTGGGRKEVAAAWAEVPVYPWLVYSLLRSSRTKHHGNQGDVRPTVSWKPATGIWVNKTNTSETPTGDLSGTPALGVLSPGLSLGWVHPRFQKIPPSSQASSISLPY